MRRVVIDTNILYSLTGVSVNEKVVTSTLNDFKLSITTPSIIEMVVKFQYDLDTIKSYMSKSYPSSLTLEVTEVNSRLSSTKLHSLSRSNNSIFATISKDEPEKGRSGSCSP